MNSPDSPQSASPPQKVLMPNMHERDSYAFDESAPTSAQAPPVVSEDHSGKDCFTSDAEFDNLMNLKGFPSSAVKSKSLKKSTMVFPTRSYPSRTRSVVKDIHPQSTNRKGKRKIDDSEVDPDCS